MVASQHLKPASSSAERAEDSSEADREGGCDGERDNNFCYKKHGTFAKRKPGRGVRRILVLLCFSSVVI